MKISNKIAFLRVAAGITALTFLPIEFANGSEKKLFGKQYGQEHYEQDYMDVYLRKRDAKYNKSSAVNKVSKSRYEIAFPQTTFTRRDYDRNFPQAVLVKRDYDRDYPQARFRKKDYESDYPQANFGKRDFDSDYPQATFSEPLLEYS